MKKQTHKLTSSLLASLAAALLATTLHAQTAGTPLPSGYAFNGNAGFSDDDLFLVVSDTADQSTSSYIVDLGSIGNLTSATGTVDLGNFSTDLQSTFGSLGANGTFESSQAQWEIVGNPGYNGDDPNWNSKSSVFTANGNNSTLFPSNKYTSGKNATLAKTTASNVLDGTYGAAPDSVIISPAIGDASAGKFGTAEKSYTSFADANGNPEASSADFVAFAATASGTTPNAPETLGTFTFDTTGADAGELLYTPAAVPEPSSLSMLLVGFGFLGWMVRRRFAATMI